MKKILLSLIAVIMIISPGTSLKKPSPFEIPMRALKALGESRVDGCQYCVDNFEKSAFRILNRYFLPGRVFLFEGKDSSDLLLKRDVCRVGELLPSLYTQREKGTNGEGVSYEFPLVVFFFHTKRHYHSGMDKKVFTRDAVDLVYLEKTQTPGRAFTGRIRLIDYPYGNGKSFIYFRKRNVLQVHCRVEKLNIY